MRIGVPKEIKVHEYRVGLVPAAVRELTTSGHEVVIQSGAGAGVGCSDDDYRSAGAKIAADADAVFNDSQLIVKVKEPQLAECDKLRPGQVLFTYLHLAADRAQAQALIQSHSVAIAYETVTSPDGSLPLLTPMSEVAGRMAVQVGAQYLLQGNGGRGILLGGVPGVAPAKVVVIGAGVAGTNAIEMAHGLRANVIAIDRSIRRLRELDVQFRGAVRTLYSTAEAIETFVADADLVVGAVLLPGGRGTEARQRRDDQAHAYRLGGGRRGDRSGRLF
jgi:alanine dehydrogenase